MYSWLRLGNLISSNNAEIYAKMLYKAGVPSIERLQRRRIKNSSFLSKVLIGCDEDDMDEIQKALDRMVEINNYFNRCSSILLRFYISLRDPSPFAPMIFLVFLFRMQLDHRLIAHALQRIQK